MRKVFKISDEQIKDMYLSGSSLSDIAKVAQDTKNLMALKKRLNDMGVSTSVSQKKYSHKLSKTSKKYTLNENIFETIDTEEKAYWLGFLFADGYNHETKTCVALRLQAADKEILEKYKTFLGTNVPIYTFKRVTSVNKLHREYCEVNVCSPIFSEQLAKWGCKQGKTFNLHFPDIPEHLYRHFIRGFFDGDGCLSIRDRNNRRKKYGTSMNYQLCLYGLETILLPIQNILVKELDLTPTKLAISKKIKTLHYTGKQVVSKIMKYLYKDATVYLKRKHDTYLEYCISVE